jgi:predicted DNA-binding transcriptional regulator YafY
VPSKRSLTNPVPAMLSRAAPVGRSELRPPTRAAAAVRGVGRATGKFTQYRKLDRIREALAARPAGLTLAELATIANLSTRSVRRYLNELERTLEIESVSIVPGGAHLWRINLAERGRSLVLRRTQAYALLAARGVYEPLRGAALFDEIDLSFRELQTLAERPSKKKGRGEISSELRLDERFLFLAEPFRQYPDRGEEIDRAFLAVAEGFALALTLKSAEGASGRSVFHPHALLLADGSLHLVGVFEAGPIAKLIDAVPLEEITALELCDSAPAVLSRVKFAELLEGRFGVRRASDPAPVRVVIEFDKASGAEFRVKRVHPSQRIAIAKDGRVRVAFVTGRVERVVAWVLGFGASARVIEPPALRSQVMAQLFEAHRAYRED